MKKISLVALVGALCVFAARADFVEMRETMVTVDPVNGDVPAPQNADAAAVVATTTTTTTMAPTPAGVIEVITVQQAKQLPDDTALVLRGNIVKSLGDEKYTFQDATDTITVEIDDEDWNGVIVSPNDIVTIWGTVDNGIFRTEIDVDRIEKM